MNRILWVVALPILMDLFLWLGPQLGAAPVFKQVGSWYTQMTEVYQNVAGANVDASTLDQARQAIAGFETQSGHFNLLSLLVINIASVPSILPPAWVGAATFQIGSLVGVIGVVLLTQVVGMLIGCIYLGVMGQQIRDGKFRLETLGRRVWFYWLSVIGFILLAIGVGLVIIIPVTLAIGLIQLIAPGVGVALWYAALAAVQIAAILFMVYLFFLVDAIVVSEVGPVRAAARSARVVANNFWRTVGFIALIYVISLGTQEIWKALSSNPAGIFIAIVGNAYIASGLTAASLLYYQSRVARLPAASGVLGRVSA
ncbi:MAG TPA: hypothetical protein VNL16_13905 [Chloroflexota bacterium]|nr:hypothetical protein [Chloroflexota bacterium]